MVLGLILPGNRSVSRASNGLFFHANPLLKKCVMTAQGEGVVRGEVEDLAHGGAFGGTKLDGSGHGAKIRRILRRWRL